MCECEWLNGAMALFVSNYGVLAVASAKVRPCDNALQRLTWDGGALQPPTRISKIPTHLNGLNDALSDMSAYRSFSPFRLDFSNIP